jgi:hypothetical protein
MKEETEKLKRIIVELEKELEQANKMIDYLVERDARRLNSDLWMTVPDFIHFIYEEKLQKQSFNRSRHKTSEDIQTEIESRIRGTHKKLKSMGSEHMFKSNKEGNYYRLPKIVEAVIQCGYVVELYRETIINNKKLIANSKTKTDLELDGFIEEKREL